MTKILKVIKSVLPPFVTSFLLKNSPYFGYTIWEYAPQGFYTVISNKGWSVKSIAEIQAVKWKDYHDRISSSKPIGINHENEHYDNINDPFFHNLLISFAYVLGLSSIHKQSVKILDWGGGIGHYGHLSEELFKEANLNIDYYCYDFPFFCEQGKKINPGYTFFSDENLFKELHFDLIIASSSIWYEKDWKSGINKICRFNSDYVYITRMIFIQEQPSYVALQKPKQKGYETEYLFWVINENHLIEYISSKKYFLIREFEFGIPTPIFQAPEQGKYKGFLFKKINHNNERFENCKFST